MQGNDEPRDLLDRIRAEGRTAYGDGWKPTRVSLAPGRLELLGNHVDYNGGPVLAAAIDRVVAVSVDDGGAAGELRAIASDVSDEVISVPIPGEHDWHSLGGEPDAEAYLRGAIAALVAGGHEIRTRARLAVAGDVPLGFGISSSAALCVALVNAVTASALSQHEVVLTAQEAEHRAGTPCGKMDQSASVAGNVILYNGADDSFSRLEPDLGPYIFAVADSGVSRSLSASSYPTRVEESRQALRLLRQRLDPSLSALGALTSAQRHEIERHGHEWLPAPLFQRVRHVFTECERVRAGISAMERSDWTTFGHLMTESGESSATDYDISHPHVEELATEARSVDGVLGARMMGGGEGGPALVLLHRDTLSPLQRRLMEGYYRRHQMADGHDRVQVCRFGPGAHVIDLPASSNFS